MGLLSENASFTIAISPQSPKLGGWTGEGERAAKVVLVHCSMKADLEL